MKLFKISIVSFLLAGALMSCQKDVEYFLPDSGQNGPDTSWYASVSATMPVSRLSGDLQMEKKTDSFEITNTTLITTGPGVQLAIAPNTLLTNAGTAVTGRIKATTLLLKKKGEMIRMGMPTVSNGRLLISGGAFYLQLNKDTQALHLAQQAALQVRFAATPTSNLMKVFNAESTVGNGGFNWLINTDTSYNKVVASADQYYVYTNRLNWVGVDRLVDTAGITQTTLAVKLPSNYTNANTMVWIAFNEQLSVVGLNADVINRRFVSGRIPANKTVTVVVLSRQGNDYFMAHEQVTTTASTSTGLQPVQLSPVISSLDNIRVYLNSL